MIGLDSNVLVRYLTLDDPKQSERAVRLIERELSESEPGFISILVLMETIWVLRRLYKVTANEVLQTVSALIGTPQLRIEGRDTVLRAVRLAEASGCSLSDCLIVTIGELAGCTKVVSFDKGALRAGMTQLRA